MADGGNNTRLPKAERLAIRQARLAAMTPEQRAKHEEKKKEKKAKRREIKKRELDTDKN